MLRAMVALAGCLALAGCGGTGRMLSYGMELADAKVRLGEAEFQIYAHPSEPTLLVQRSLSQIGGGTGTVPEFAAAASKLIKPLDCAVTDAKQISAGTFEVTYSCPDGTDIRAAIASQRPNLRSGAPLRRQ